MYKLANDAERNAKMIPEVYWPRCKSVVEGIFESDLRFHYTGDQLWWLVQCYDAMGGDAPVEWWDFADGIERSEGSQVWDLASMRESADAFRAAVVADWKSGVVLHFVEYPVHVLKSAEHLKPVGFIERSDMAENLLDVLTSRL